MDKATAKRIVQRDVHGAFLVLQDTPERLILCVREWDECNMYPIEVRRLMVSETGCQKWEC